MISRFKIKPWRSKAYLKFVRGKSCLVCGFPFDVQAHHLRHAEKSGMGRKVDDRWVAPLCYRCHMDCHTRGDEASWWSDNSCGNPIEWAEKTYKEWSGDGNADVDVQ